MTQDMPADEPERDFDPDATEELAIVTSEPLFAAILDEFDAQAMVVATSDPVTDVPIRHEPPRVAEDGLQILGERVDRRFDELKSLFEREIRAEGTREKVVDRLHAELQEYKQDLLLSMLRPIFIDLIQLHDDIGKVAVVPADEAGQTDARRLVGLMEGFQQGIEDILYRQGVEPYEVDDHVFDPRRQRAVATVATDDPALNKTVAVRHRKGFRSGDRMIRPEVVSVFATRKG